jgi:hypothetical protein
MRLIRHGVSHLDPAESADGADAFAVGREFARRRSRHSGCSVGELPPVAKIIVGCR